jgi:diguanylate cyclase (GGDEF)-like protein/PAS domain S-box-containing protein
MTSKFRPFPGIPNLPRGRKLVVIVWLFAGIVACLLVAALASVALLSGGRAYVGAEGIWSRSQKEAVFHLSRFALDRAEVDYAAYERAIKVPLGDRRARQELAKPHPDVEIARSGLLQSRNHPGDIDAMILLHRYFSDFAPVERTIALWDQADAHIDELIEVARELRAEKAPFTRAQSAHQVARINQIDAALTPLEDEIAASLSYVQRTAQTLLLAGMLVLAGILLAAGILISKRFVLQNEKLQRALRESEGQLRHLIESAPLPLLILRASDQHIIYANDRALQQFALDMDSVRGLSLLDFHADTTVRDALTVAIARAGTVRDYEVQMKDRNGRTFWLLLSAQRLQLAGEECLLAALANIDDRKRLQEDMRRRAMHDPLTTLPNRAMFMEALERAVRKARRRASRFSVLFIDLDRFKEVNDTLGHHAGDELLQSVAERLKSAVRQSDLVARLGGDEFVVLVEEHKGPEEVMIVAQKILSVLERPVLLDWREVAISGSVGIASFPEDGDDIEALVKNADTAMYQAKEKGRNNFQFYSEDLNKLTLQRFEIQKRVRSAIENDEFFLQYQPEMDLKSSRFTAMEALLRWRDPSQGVVMPAGFLPHAEETGTILALGSWVIERALRDFRKWRLEGLDGALAINLSARQLQDDGLVNQVFQALQAHHVAPRLLRLEVSEATLLHDAAASDRTLRALRGLGVEVVLDNFGSANSSLGLLRRFPIQRVKIDRSLVGGCEDRRECAAMIQGVVAMARSLGMKVVAEGVETAEQRAEIARLGCDAAQGYLIARPMDAAKVPGILKVAVTENRGQTT